jgi:hypothetical protein
MEHRVPRLAQALADGAKVAVERSSEVVSRAWRDARRAGRSRRRCRLTQARPRKVRAGGGRRAQPGQGQPVRPARRAAGAAQRSASGRCGERPSRRPAQRRVNASNRAATRVAARYVGELRAATDAAAHLFIPTYRGVVCVVHCDDRAQASGPEPDPRRAPAGARNRSGQGTARVPPSVARQHPGPAAASLHGHHQRFRAAARPRRDRRPERAATPSTTVNARTVCSRSLRPSSWAKTFRRRWHSRARDPT